MHAFANFNITGQLRKAGKMLTNDTDQGLTQSISSGKSSIPKPKLAALKEMCDRHRLEYKFDKIKEIPRLKQSEFQATLKVTDKMTSETIFEVTGDTKTSKKDAKHAAADKAIHRLSKCIISFFLYM